MSDQVASGKCPHCGPFQRMTKPRVNHGLHAVLTVCTCGCWSLVWTWLILAGWLEPWRCSECGCRASRKLMQ